MKPIENIIEIAKTNARSTLFLCAFCVNYDHDSENCAVKEITIPHGISEHVGCVEEWEETE